MAATNELPKENRSSEKILDKCVESLRKLMMISITIALVWFLSWQETKRIIERYNSSLHLNAWLNLKEFSKALPKITDTTDKRELTTYKTFYDEPQLRSKSDNTLVGYYPEAPYNALSYGSISKENKLFINVYWPNPTSVSINLYRHALCSYFEFRDDTAFVRNDMRYLEDRKTMAEFYDVYTSKERFHFEDYELLRLYDSIERFIILQKVRNGHLREYDSHHYLAFDSTLAKPRYFDKSELFLTEAGINANIDSLSIKDPAVRAFLLSSSVDALSFNILGISVPINIILPFFSILIAFISFSMLGPLLILTKNNDNLRIETTWILTIQTTRGHVLFNMENLLMLVSSLFALLPLFLFILQCISGIFGIVTSWLIIINLASTIFSTIIFFKVIFLFRRIRKASF